MEEQTVSAVAAVLFLAFVVELITERVKARFAKVDGDLVTAVALVLGTGAAWAFDLQAAAELGYQGLPLPLDYLAGGLVVAGVAGQLAASKNRNRSQDPTSSIYRAGQFEEVDRENPHPVGFRE